MGLVVLSVFALAFAACGNSDSGDGTSPPASGGYVPSKVPTSVVVKSMPLAGQDGPVLEGQAVNLAGLVMDVRYNDGELKQITDSSKVTYRPSIYDARVGLKPGQHPDYPDGWYPNGYELTYTESGAPGVVFYINFPNTSRLMDLDITGQMRKQEYLIDEMVDFSGLTVNGVYSLDPAKNRLFDSGGRPINIPDASGNAPPGWAQQEDYYRRVIPLDVKNPDYKWAWVENVVPGSGSFINDQPGVLISIGSYGYIRSKIIGQGQPTDYNFVNLRGKREPVAKLYQVKELAWDPAPTPKNTVFYDDPTIISKVADEAELGVRLTNWVDLLSSAGLKVTYTNGQSKTYSLNDLQTMNTAYADTLGNFGWGGTWANLELFPVNAGIRIDVTRDTKEVMDAASVFGGINDFNWINRVRDDYNYNSGNPTASYISGNGGWAQWAQLAAGRSNMRFYWRSRYIDYPVPIYNRPASMAVASVDGVNPEIMLGGDYVYRRPEGMYEFLNKVIVSVTYSRQGGDASDTKVRSNVMSDITNGTCRATIEYPIGNRTLVMPTLYSVGIFNFKDTTGDLAKAIAWQSYTSDGTGTPQTAAIAAQASLLTKANSDLYLSRARDQRGRIEYRGWAGNPANTRMVYNQDTRVAPIEYAFDW